MFIDILNILYEQIYPVVYFLPVTIVQKQEKLSIYLWISQGYINKWTHLYLSASRDINIVKVNRAWKSDQGHWGLGEIDGLLVPPGKANTLLTDYLITG